MRVERTDFERFTPASSSPLKGKGGRRFVLSGKPLRESSRNHFYAFTLIELITSMAIMSVLLVAMGSAILLASKAIPDGQSESDTIIEAGQVLRQIADELRTAIYVNTSSADSVAFAIADRNGDGAPEAVRYVWSGTAGDPLTRQANGGSIVTVLDNVQQFALNYEIKNASEQYPGVAVESAEQVLSSHDPAVTPADYNVMVSKWIGQYFQPTLPADAISWKVTRALVMAMKSGGANGTMMVQLRQPDGANLPSTTVLKEVGLWENFMLFSYTWIDNAIELSKLTPGQGMCLVIKGISGSGVYGNFNYDANGGSGYVESSDSGGTWSEVTNQSMLHYVYGTYTTAPLPKTVTRQHLTAVRITLQHGDYPNSEVETVVGLLNAPQVLSAYWELDFNADPRVVDANVDGVGDWVDWSDSTGVFDPADLVDGVWHCPGAPYPDYTAVNTVPDFYFNELTTVDARYRATSVGGFGTVVWVNADRTASSCASLAAVLYKPDATTQELWIGNKLNNGSWDWFATLSVPDDFVNVRLIIDPVDDTFAAFVNGVHQGTYPYTDDRIDPDKMAWVYCDGCTGEFDYVRIRVGGSSP